MTFFFKNNIFLPGILNSRNRDSTDFVDSNALYGICTNELLVNGLNGELIFNSSFKGRLYCWGGEIRNEG